MCLRNRKQFYVLGSLEIICFCVLLPHICFAGGASGKEPACQCRRHKRQKFDPWVGKIPWRRAWQPTPVFLPGESPWTEEPGRLQSIGSQRVRCNWSDLAHIPLNMSSLGPRFCVIFKSPSGLLLQDSEASMSWVLPLRGSASSLSSSTD